MSSLTRRALIAQAATAALAAPAIAQPHGGGWSYEQYAAAMRASERRIGLNKPTFDAVMRRRDQALRIVENYLRGKFREADPHSLRAYAEVPREYFHYNYAGAFDFGASAYEGNAHPWAIGYGSALSDYLGQMYMTQLSRPQPGENALEIGTGSGYQISILSRVCAKAYSIEIIEPLGRAVAKIFKPLGFNNVITKVGDGYFGWPEEKEGFDIIMVTCVAQHVPPPLLAQLKPGTGRLIIPVGQPFRREQVLYVYTKDRDGKIHSRRDVGVYFIPMTGRISQGR
jgi:protein-L-isoaspartate(D-aspartate) O-methyltransferase